MNNKAYPILSRAYKAAQEEIGLQKKRGGLPRKIQQRLDVLLKSADQHKAVLTALITILVKKIEDPKQDIRLHKGIFEGGYSARSYDTAFITPFLKDHFPKVAMKESGWLTRSIEQPHPFDLNFPGRIRNVQVKKAFLEIIDEIESGGDLNPEAILIAIFVRLIQEIDSYTPIVREDSNAESTILEIIQALEKHFAAPRSSFLPVIAVYSIYQVVMGEFVRYQDARLVPLKGHTVSDSKSRSLGDIEITKDNSILEAVEVKHNIRIDYYTVLDVANKIKGAHLHRFYILTTAFPEIKENEYDKINDLLEKVRATEGCEIILNGVLPTIKYYLRLLHDPALFIDAYTKNIIYFYKNSSLVSKEQTRLWEELRKNWAS